MWSPLYLVSMVVSLFYLDFLFHLQYINCTNAQTDFIVVIDKWCRSIHVTNCIVDDRTCSMTTWMLSVLYWWNKTCFCCAHSAISSLNIIEVCFALRVYTVMCIQIDIVVRHHKILVASPLWYWQHEMKVFHIKTRRQKTKLHYRILFETSFNNEREPFSSRLITTNLCTRWHCCCCILDRYWWSSRLSNLFSLLLLIFLCVIHISYRSWTRVAVMFNVS